MGNMMMMELWRAAYCDCFHHPCCSYQLEVRCRGMTGLGAQSLAWSTARLELFNGANIVPVNTSTDQSDWLAP
jgi:hypothetical protein